MWTLRRLVGNTPLLVIACRVRGRLRTVYAKCEQFNLTGSIKDRMALHIMERAYRESRLAPGDTIVEATSGNTGISFAAIGRALGHPVTIFMPDWMSRERRDLITSFGATIVSVSADEGGFLGSIRRAEDMAATRPARVPARAVLQRRQSRRARDDARAGKSSSSSRSRGACRTRLSPASAPAARSWAWGGAFARAIPPYMFTRWSPRNHRPCRRDARTAATASRASRTSSFRRRQAATNWTRSSPVHDGDAIVMAQMLARDLGLGVGISSGANFAARSRSRTTWPDDAVVVTVFPDSNKKYLSTDLLATEPVRPGYVSGETELLGFSALPRVCSGCIDYRPAPLATRVR